MGYEDLEWAIKAFKEMGISPYITNIYPAFDGIIFETEPKNTNTGILLQK